jgi:hypothetical protein
MAKKKRVKPIKAKSASQAKRLLIQIGPSGIMLLDGSICYCPRKS